MALIDKIKNRVSGDQMTTTLLELLKGDVIKMIPAIGTLLYQLVVHGADSLKMVADDRCTSCSSCEVICPVKNIIIVNGRPTWGEHCLGCFACIQWCGQSAITFGGKTLGVKKYTHPEVTFEEMRRML